MLQVASILFRCCIYICFVHMLQAYVPNISSASGVCCIQVFSCFRGMFRESRGHGPSAGEEAWQVGGRRMGCMARLGSCGRSVPVLISALGASPRGERGGGQEEGAAGAGAGYACEAGQGGRGQTRMFFCEWRSGMRGRVGWRLKPGSRNGVF